MLLVYVVTLLVGAVMVGLSFIGGGDHEAGAEGHFAGDGHLHLEIDGAGVESVGVEGAEGGGEPGGLFIPFLSPRFWFFGACFFGLTGLALTQLGAMGEPGAAWVAAGVGVAAGWGASGVVRALRAPLGSVQGSAAWVGRVGELRFELEPGRVSKMIIPSEGTARPGRELLAVLEDGAQEALPRGARVVVLELRGERAVVALEHALFGGPRGGGGAR